MRQVGAKSGMRSLMLGVHERDGSLRFAGTVKAELKPRPLAELEKKRRNSFGTIRLSITRPRAKKIATSFG
jgi:hypothetical protein